MGLDWNPIGKPKPGFEVEFERVFKLLGSLPVNVGWFEKLRRRLKGIDRDAIGRRWCEIQITPYQTLQAPQVGVSDAANGWALQRYAEMKDPKPPKEAFLQEMQGYYVTDNFRRASRAYSCGSSPTLAVTTLNSRSQP